METLAILSPILIKPILKHLAGKWLGDWAKDAAGGGYDLFAKNMADASTRKRAEKQLTIFAERIVEQLVPIFGRHLDDAALKRVARELATTLDAEFDASVLVAGKMDAARVADLLREARPLPKGQYGEAESSAYERALDGVARLLVAAASQIRGYDAARDAEVLVALETNAPRVLEILETVRRLELEITGASDRYESDYRQALIGKLDWLELFGVELTPECSRYPLTDAYVTLTLEGAQGDTTQSVEQTLDSLLGGSTSDNPAWLHGEGGIGKTFAVHFVAGHGHAESTPFDGNDRTEERLLRQTGAHKKKTARLFIRGVAGSGKTTLMRWIAVRAAATAGSRGWRGMVPFFVRMRDCEDGRLPSVDELPRTVLDTIGAPPQSWAANLLREGDGLILLDGIDEVAIDDRDRVREGIRELVATYPKAPLIVTTRPEAVADNWLDGEAFHVASVAPLTGDDRRRLIEKWHASVAEQRRQAGFSTESIEAAPELLLAALADAPTLARLATNPLMAAMVCALHLDHNHTLPSGAYELLAALSKMIVFNRDEERRVFRAALPNTYSRMDYARRRGLLQDAAAKMINNGAASLSVTALDAEIRRALGEYGQDPAETEEVRERLLERSGVLREEPVGRVEFLHNAFRDFLAGTRLAASEDWGVLERCLADPAQLDVVLYAVSDPDQHRATKHLAKHTLVKLDAAADEPSVPLRLAALRLSESTGRLPAELRERLRKHAEALIPPQTMGAAAAVAELGDEVVPRLRSPSHRANARTTAASVRALGLIGTPAAEEAIEGYIEDERKSVASEMAQHVNPLRLAIVQQSLLVDGSLPEYVDPARVTDATPLAKLTNLQSIDLGLTRVTDATPLAKLTNLQSIDLSFTGVTDVTPFAKLTNLQSIDLSFTGVTDVIPLAKLTNLQSLNLSNTGVTDVTPLAKLTNLQSIDLSGTRVTDVIPLAKLTNLQSIDLNGTRVTDVIPLAKLTNLQSLNLSNTGVTDVTPLAKLTNLQSLNLSNMGVTDVTSLAKLTNLQSLNLSNTGVTDVTPLAKLTNLQSLNLSGMGVTDVTPLAKLTNLHSLYLSSTGVTDVTPLAKLTNLHSLYLSSTGVTDVTPLAKLTKLQSLYLSFTGVTDVTPLAKLTNLQSLNLTGMGVTDVSPLAGLKNLKIYR